MSKTLKEYCNRCGACCYLIRGVIGEWNSKGWLAKDGSCKFYDKETKSCTIYDNRPTRCRAELTCPIDMTLEQWHAQLSQNCTSAHMLVFGTDWEGPDTPCQHKH